MSLSHSRGPMPHHDHIPKPDEFTADLERDSKGRHSSSMDDLVREDAEPPRNEPVEEEYIADPEAHHQHSRKGQAERARGATAPRGSPRRCAWPARGQFPTRAPSSRTRVGKSASATPGSPQAHRR